ncbi:MAG TPA: hypothetical protein VNZ64_01755 [Candidatus Acidoferrum sp.]|jgi:hypothetical protein|nr:hypothetical protein [Candidatus Acidoferrum sp.]
MNRFAGFLLVLLLAAAAWYGLSHHRTPTTPKLPTTLDEFKQQPGGASTVDAGDFLFALAKQGKLPGFSPGEHGAMHAGIVDANGDSPSVTASETYPISRGITFSKEDDTSVYFYIVVQTSNNAPWKLQKAWRTDADGHVVQNYPVP